MKKHLQHLKSNDWIVKTFACPSCGHETTFSGSTGVVCANVSCPVCTLLYRGKISDAACNECTRRIECLTNNVPVVVAKKLVEFLSERSNPLG